jgi:hypothetical protein
MKVNIFCLFLLLLLLLAPVNSVWAKAHFNTGGSGYKLSSLPPPGFYYKVYNAYYSADDYRNNDGDKAAGDTRVRSFSQSHRFIWSTDLWLAGGNVLLDLTVPLSYSSLSSNLTGRAGTVDKFGVGDPLFHVLLSWHDPKWDFLLAMGAHIPVGEYHKNDPVSPGKGYWGLQPSIGGTWYFDEERTWTLSALLRYEISFEQKGTDLREGDNFHVEAAFGKKVNDWLALALAGAGSWQTTSAKGKGTSNDYLSGKLAFGPEVLADLPGRAGNLSLRFLFDVDSKNNPEGIMIVFTWTYAF